MTLLTSLLFDRYQSLIFALDVAGKDNLSLNNVKAIFLNEAERLADSNADSLRAVASFVLVSKSKSRRQLKCNVCGTMGILQRIAEVQRREIRMHHMSQIIQE